MPDRTRLVPVIAVVSETTVTGLASAVEATREHINEHPEWADLCRRNSWTPEALAYGALLDAVAEETDDAG